MSECLSGGGAFQRSLVQLLACLLLAGGAAAAAAARQPFLRFWLMGWHGLPWATTPQQTSLSNVIPEAPRHLPFDLIYLIYASITVLLLRRNPVSR